MVPACIPQGEPHRWEGHPGGAQAPLSLLLPADSQAGTGSTQGTPAPELGLPPAGETGRGVGLLWVLGSPGHPEQPGVRGLGADWVPAAKSLTLGPPGSVGAAVEAEGEARAAGRAGPPGEVGAACPPAHSRGTAGVVCGCALTPEAALATSAESVWRGCGACSSAGVVGGRAWAGRRPTGLASCCPVAAGTRPLPPDPLPAPVPLPRPSPQ